MRNTIHDLNFSKTSNSSHSIKSADRCSREPFPVRADGRAGFHTGAAGTGTVDGDPPRRSDSDDETLATDRSSDVGRSTNATDDANAL